MVGLTSSVEGQQDELGSFIFRTTGYNSGYVWRHG
jgi:hypothetical protein